MTDTAVPEAVAAAPTTRVGKLREAVLARFGERVREIPAVEGEVAFAITPAEWTTVCAEMRDAPELLFEQLIDLSGIDYLQYGIAEWKTDAATRSGFSRGGNRFVGLGLHAAGEVPANQPRFAVVIHLLSVTHNHRVRLSCTCEGHEPPMANSLVDVWAAANWYEREAFDLYGILFNGHPDLRRILTDYGFIGHPFRKDFPLAGHVEVRYDPDKQRVVYEPVSIEPRVVVPKTIRDDNRYAPGLTRRG